MNELGKEVRNAFSPSFRKELMFETVDPRTGEVKPMVSRTKQADKDGCDINKILERYERTGQLPAMIQREPKYGDFSNVPDFMEACELVERVNEQFESLSASVRHKFDNDPAKMLEFVQTATEDQLVQYGLAVKKESGAEGSTVAPAVGASETPVK